MTRIPDVEIPLFKYIEICKDYFLQRSYAVEEDPSLHEAVRWRPHLLLRKAAEFKALEVRVATEFPNFWLEEIEKAGQLVPELEVFVAIPKEVMIQPRVLVDAQRLGIGAYEIDGTILSERIVPERPTDQTIQQEQAMRLPTFVVKSDTPYGNILALRKLLRSCRGHLHWLDRHFGRNGLERIYEAIGSLETISEIHVVCGLFDNVNARLRNDMKRLSAEFADRGIALELRVVVDRDLLQEVHDRFIMTEGAVYNVLPVNAIEMGQFGEMFATSAQPPFERFWDAGLDILAEWNEILREDAAYKERRGQD